jgi:MinD-like ATPase involved in chromosome partitioning or flagellar assembly
VIGAARGVGRSTVALNVAGAIAKLGRRVCLLDASHAQRERATLLDVAAGRARLSDALETGPDGIDSLGLTPADRRAPEGVSDASLLANVDALESRYDLVLVDAPGLAQPRGAFFAGAATDVVLVATGEEQALRHAETLVRTLAARCGRHELLLVPNACADANEAITIARTLGALAARPPHVRVQAIGWIPSDPSIARVRRAHRSLVVAAPDAPAARACEALAHRLTSLAPPRPTGAAQFFFQSLIAQGRAA